MAIAAALLACLAGSTPAWADRVVLPHLPADYGWWNGCSPTAAGMLFGYWEEEAGGLYDAFPGNHLDVPASYPATSSNPADYEDARGVIAGWAHKQQGMAEGLSYGSSRNHPPDSLADFLLTWDSETQRDAVAHGLVTFAAWDDPRTPEIESRRFAASTAYRWQGWTFEDYMAEIDAGRPVHVGFTSDSAGAHALLGVGYNNSDGKQNMVVLTTWGQGLRGWEWPQETVTGRGYRVFAGTTLRPLEGPAPRLSAYVSITHTYITDLTIEIGVGDPAAPEWNAIVWDQAGGGNNLALTDIDLTPQLASFHGQQLDWYLKVTDSTFTGAGWIEDFQVRYAFDQLAYQWGGSHVPIPDATPNLEDPWQPDVPGVVAVTLQTPAVPARQLLWAGGVGVWSDANWLEGAEPVAPSGDEAMQITSGKVTVTEEVAGNRAAAAVDLQASQLWVQDDALLEVFGPVSVAGGATLTVDGVLSADRLEVAQQGILAGSGAIVTGTLSLSGAISPGGAGDTLFDGGTSATFASSQHAWSWSGEYGRSAGTSAAAAAVPEPCARVVLLAALATLVGARAWGRFWRRALGR